LIRESAMTDFPATLTNTLPPPRNRWQDFWWRYSRNRLAVLGLILVLGLFFTGTFAPILAPFDYNDQNLAEVEQGPSLIHPLGTDELGRDQLSRVIWGARTALIVAPSATFVGVTLGLLFGALAGFFGGMLDTLIMRIADILFAFPGILFALLIAATLQPRIEAWLKSMDITKGMARSGYSEFFVVILALSIVGWPGIARLVRGQILSLKEQDYVEAAQAIGASPWRIIRHHLLPNAMAPVIVAISMGMGGAIIAEATLSFLGIGIQPPTASWGRMIIDNYSFWRNPLPVAFVLVWLPGLIVGAVGAAFNFIGDGLNDALNPYQMKK